MSVRLSLSLPLIAAMAALLPASAAVAAGDPPTVTTGGVTNVTPTGVTVNGSVDPNGASTDAFVEYGKGTKLSQRTPSTPVGSGTKAVKVAIALSGLEPVTKYSYRVVGRSSRGGTNGTTRTFTTPRIPASVTLAAAPGVVPFGSGVTLSGTVGGTGAGGSRVQVEFAEFPYLSGFAAAGNALIADPAGAFAQTVVPRVTTQYRAQAKVDGRDAVSPTITVGVAPRVFVTVRRRGSYLSFSGSIAPGGDAIVRLVRISPTGRRTTLQRTITRGAERTSYRFKRHRSRRTANYVVSVTPANGAFVPGESRVRRVKGRR